jgi:arylsulfatase
MEAGGPRPEGPWELYDMERDRTELCNLADQHPEVVRELATAWEEWARRTHVLPWPWVRNRR